MNFVSARYLAEHGVPRVDYHLHSTFSDGKNTPEDYVTSAIKTGLDEIALTEHVWRTSEWIPRFIQNLKDLRQRYQYPILAGVEAKAINMDGEIDLDKKWMPQIDLIMGVIHRLPSKKDYTFINRSQIEPEKAALIETEATISMIKRGEIHVLGHPTLDYYRCYRERHPFPLEYIQEIISEAKKHKIALEIAGMWCNDSRLLETAFQEEALISFGSGAHSSHDVGKINRGLVHQALKKTYPNLEW
jgi:HisJ family histidinol phosphate phosphatase